MERIVLSAEKRENVGKGVARSLRRAGMIPAVLYRAGKSQPIKIQKKEFSNLLKKTAGEKVLVNLKFTDGNDRLAVMKDYQFDPINGDILHTDFYEVSLTEKIRATVHVVTVGEPIGVKRDGGVLQYGIREVEIECLPDQMPGHLEIDITGLGTGHSVHVRDLKVAEGVKILSDPSDVIATVVAPAVEKPAAEAVEAAPSEPEVVKKGKKAEEEAEEKA